MNDLLQVAREIRDAFDDHPGISDLDNEQPIHITIPLGTWRRLNFHLAMKDSLPEVGGAMHAEAVALFRDMPMLGDEWGMLGYEEEFDRKVKDFLKRYDSRTPQVEER